MAEIALAWLIKAQTAGAAAMLLVLAVRLAARRAFGPQAAYLLWATVPLAMAGSLLPRPVDMMGNPAGAGAAAAADVLAGAGLSGPMVGLWLAGAGLILALMTAAQLRFAAAARSGRAGPAAVGAFAPRVVMPADDGRWTPEERALIRAHERTHVARRDPTAGALAALICAASWFNPLAWLCLRVMRVDQELACDAATLRGARGRTRRLYAETLLKTQLAARPLPFGCYWPARGTHPLETRIRLLAAPFDARRHEWGLAAMAATAACAALVAWMVQPKEPPRSFLQPEPAQLVAMDIAPEAGR